MKYDENAKKVIMVNESLLKDVMSEDKFDIHIKCILVQIISLETSIFTGVTHIANELAEINKRLLLK